MFNQTHETKDGKVMMICEMRTDHLKNTVNMHLDKLKAAKEALDNNPNVSNFEKKLYGFDQKRNQETAEKIIEKTMAKLPAYLMECMVRGIDYGPQLRAILKRTTCEVTNPFSLFQQSKELSIQTEPFYSDPKIGSIENKFFEEEIREFEQEYEDPF
jgi:hypothetical protein